MPYPPPFSWPKFVVKILILFAIYYGYEWYTAPDLSINKIVHEDPELVLVKDGKTWTVDDYQGYTFKEVATLKLRAKVLSTHNYGWWNTWLQLYEPDTTEISSEDFFLGWGEMSNNLIWSKLKLFSDDHSYQVTIPKSFPLSIEYFEFHSDNAHIIPANVHVRYLLRHLKVNDVVKFKGSLVNIRLPGGGEWNSGFDHRNHDLGSFVCFVYYVTDVIVEEPGE